VRQTRPIEAAAPGGEYAVGDKTPGEDAAPLSSGSGCARLAGRIRRLPGVGLDSEEEPKPTRGTPRTSRSPRGAGDAKPLKPAL